MQWQKETIVLDDKTTAEAQAPVIISASRATDIPTFYSDWFISRWEAGYIKWINPFNSSPQSEIQELIRVKNILKNEKSSVMLITNYQFFSSLNQKIYYQPNRWYTSDGVSYPVKNSKYFLVIDFYSFCFWFVFWR